MRILVVEDNYLVADLIAAVLREAGHQVVGPCAGADDALPLCEPTLDIGLLDVNLGDGEDSEEIAVRLEALGVPIVFVTGYPVDVLPRYRWLVKDRVCLMKPMRGGQIVEAVETYGRRRRPIAACLTGILAPQAPGSPRR